MTEGSFEKERSLDFMNEIFELKEQCALPAATRLGFLRMKNDFCKIIFHPQTPLVLNAKKILLHGIKYYPTFLTGFF